MSYSPLMYRQRAAWPAVSDHLVQDVIQPERRAREDDGLLADYALRIDRALAAVADAVAAARLDALIVLYADHGDIFDESNVPQLHIQAGGEIWGDPSIEALGEAPAKTGFVCEAVAAELLLEELVRAGFDVSEARQHFKPVGRTGRGAGPALCEAVSRVSGGVPIIPVHVNCHIEPTLRGGRLRAFGSALAAAAQLSDRRLGILVSGGLSGDPGGPMAGWIDDVLDEWVLTRLARGQAAEMAGIWGAQSRTLKGSSAEIRLWTVAAAAFERLGCRAEIIDYMPVHHAASGIAFVKWEPTSCQ